MSSAGAAQESHEQTQAVPDLREEQARALFQAGRAAYADGRFEDALDAFTRSYELSGRAQLLYNIGQAADRLRLDERSLRAFEEYLAAVPDTPHRTSIERRIEVLRKSSDKERADANGAQGLEASTNAQSAPAVDVAPLPAGESGRHDSAQDGIAKKWWFWTLVGVVVVGGVTGGVVAARSGTSSAAPVAGVDHTFSALVKW